MRTAELRGKSQVTRVSVGAATDLGQLTSCFLSAFSRMRFSGKTSVCRLLLEVPEPVRKFIVLSQESPCVARLEFAQIE